MATWILVLALFLSSLIYFFQTPVIQAQTTSSEISTSDNVDELKRAPANSENADGSESQDKSDTQPTIQGGAESVAPDTVEEVKIDREPRGSVESLSAPRK